jgi:hypothetical protein
MTSEQQSLFVVVCRRFVGFCLVVLLCVFVASFPVKLFIVHSVTKGVRTGDSF